MQPMRTDYLDTILFAAAAVLGIAWLAVTLWYRSILRDMDRAENDSLNDPDMRDDDEPKL